MGGEVTNNMLLPNYHRYPDCNIGVMVGGTSEAVINACWRRPARREVHKIQRPSHPTLRLNQISSRQFAPILMCGPLGGPSNRNSRQPKFWLVLRVGAVWRMPQHLIIFSGLAVVYGTPFLGLFERNTTRNPPILAMQTLP